MFRPSRSVKKFIDGVIPLLKSEKHSIENIFYTLTTKGKNIPAFIFKEKNEIKKLSYIDLKNEVEKYSNKIHSSFSTLNEGDILILQLPNSKDWVITYFAILKAGFKPFFLNPKLTKTETEDLIKESNAKGIILKEKQEYSIPNFTLEEILSNEKTSENNFAFQDEIIFTTSGTTGQPKIFVFNGESLVANLETSLNFPKETNDLLYSNKNGKLRVLALAPFFHIFGFISILSWHLFYNSTIVFLEDISYSNIKKTILEFEVSHIYFVPTFFDSVAKDVTYLIGKESIKEKEKINKIIEKNLAGKKLSFKDKRKLKNLRLNTLGNKIRFLISGGGQSLELTTKTLNGIGYSFHNGFGMTETGVTSFELSSEIKERIKNSIGHPLSPIKYSLKPVEGKKGYKELFIESKTVHIKEIVKGKTILNDITKPFPTGDIATIDTNGKYFIKGRIKDTIISSNGENINPDDLEPFFSNIKNISSYVIFGGNSKGSNYEKIVLAYEVNSNISDDQFKEIKKELLKRNEEIGLKNKVEEFLIFKNEVPRVNGMKISRNKVKELYLSKDKEFYSIKEPRHITEFQNFPIEEIKKIVNDLKEEFSKFLKIPLSKIEDDSHWIDDLGGNSLSYIDLVMSLQGKYNLKIPQEKYGVFTTVNDFALEILKQKYDKEKIGSK